MSIQRLGSKLVKHGAETLHSFLTNLKSFTESSIDSLGLRVGKVEEYVSGFKKVGDFAVGVTLPDSKSVVYNPKNGMYYKHDNAPYTIKEGDVVTSFGFRCVGLLRGYPLGDVRNWSTLPSATTPTDIANNTSVLQLMFDSLGDKGVAIFPEGITTRFNTLWIRNRDFTVCGSGVLDGTLKVCCPTFATSPDIYMNCTIKDVTFETTRGLNDAIQMAYARMGTITNIKDVRGFSNFIRVMAVKEAGGTQQVAWGQHCNRWIVSNCHYGASGVLGKTVERFIQSDLDDLAKFPIADWIVQGNEGHATHDHVVLSMIDGFTLDSNIMFFPGYQTRSQTKRSHLRVERGGGWLQVSNNKFFESGGASVYLSGCSRFELHDNLYAFGSQRLPEAQILATGTPLAGDKFTQASIHNEHIVSCGGAGIQVASGNGRMKLHDCNIQSPGDTQYYYGTAQQYQIGISVAANTLAVEVYNNTTREANNSLAEVSNNIYRNNVIDKLSSGHGLTVQTTQRA
jgi:hypothetical protein|nr:MAG TPA: alpha-1, 3-glucanase [Caudoviricetes sp.]